MIRRGVKVQLAAFLAHHHRRHQLRQRPLRRARRPAARLRLRRHRRLRRVRRHLRERRGDLPRGRRRPGRPAAAGRRRRARRPADRPAASTVPADTVAVVENRSAVGEQYVDLQPRTSGGPVPRRRRPHRQRRTTAPRCTPRTLLLNLDRLVELGRQARPGRRHRRARQGVLGHRPRPPAAARLRRRPDPGRGRRPARDHPADRGRADRAGHPARVRLGDQELLRRPGRPQRHAAHQRRRPAQGPRQRHRRLPGAADR